MVGIFQYLCLFLIWERRDYLHSWYDSRWFTSFKSFNFGVLIQHLASIIFCKIKKFSCFFNMNTMFLIIHTLIIKIGFPKWNPCTCWHQFKDTDFVGRLVSIFIYPFHSSLKLKLFSEYTRNQPSHNWGKIMHTWKILHTLISNNLIFWNFSSGKACEQ